MWRTGGKRVERGEFRLIQYNSVTKAMFILNTQLLISVAHHQT